MYSPLRQVEAQRDVYKKIWNNRLSSNKVINFIKRALAENNFTNTHRVLVVAANNETILNTKYAPKDIKDKVIRVDALVRKIQYDLDKSDKEKTSGIIATGDKIKIMTLNEDKEYSVKSDCKYDSYDYYSKYKLKAEKYIQNNLKNYSIFRLAYVLGDPCKESLIYNVKTDSSVEMISSEDAGYAFVSAIDHQKELIIRKRLIRRYLMYLVVKSLESFIEIT
mgnify:CR=1 FL=1